MAKRMNIAATTLASMAIGGVGLICAAPASAETEPPVTSAANTCDVGALCVYEDPDFGGSHFEHQGNQSDWLATRAPAALRNKDSSWANRYQSWYWACVYDKTGYVNETAWIKQGVYLPRAGSGMIVNRGESHHGWYSGSTC